MCGVIFGFRCCIQIALFLTTTLYCSQLCIATQGTIVIGQISHRDINKPSYKVHFPPVGQFRSRNHPLEDEIPLGFIQDTVVTANGQKLRCLLPSSQHEKHVSNSDQIGEENVYDDIDELFHEYEKNGCFYRQDGWWTYEFCYGGHVSQKHYNTEKSKNGDYTVADEFVLGYYDRKVDLERRKNISVVSTADVAFTQLYTNGTVCDVTNKPRQVLIKFRCTEDTIMLQGRSKLVTSDELTILSSVREVELCVYEIEFFNNAICHHSAYKRKVARNAKPIHCSVEKGQAAFQGLSSNKYYKPSLIM